MLDLLVMEPILEPKEKVSARYKSSLKQDFFRLRCLIYDRQLLTVNTVDDGAVGGGGKDVIVKITAGKADRFVTVITKDNTELTVTIPFFSFLILLQIQNYMLGEISQGRAHGIYLGDVTLIPVVGISFSRFEQAGYGQAADMLHKAERVGDDNLEVSLHIDITFAGIADFMLQQFTDFTTDVFIVTGAFINHQRFDPPGITAR